MRTNHHDEAEAEEILGRGGIVLHTVDCAVCGAVMVPHLVWPERPPHKAGLCDLHFPAAEIDELGRLTQ